MDGRSGPHRGANPAGATSAARGVVSMLAKFNLNGFLLIYGANLI